jgi:hypothetical protein
MDFGTRKRSLIERSLLEHIPILVSSNDLIFLNIRVRLALENIASNRRVDEKQIFDAKALFALQKLDSFGKFLAK